MRKILMATLAVAGLSACGGDDYTCAEPTFSSIHDNILATNSCASTGCHGSDSVYGGLDFGAGAAEVYRQLTEDASQAMDASASARVGMDTASSYLYIRMMGLDSALRMPPNEALPACQTDAVKAWIEAGAPNN